MTSNQVVSTIFNINIYIHMDRFIPFWGWDEDPGNTSLLRAYTRCQWRLSEYLEYSSMVIVLATLLICILSHKSALYWSMAMFCHIVAPLCIISWLWPDWVMEIWIHIVYLVAISLVSSFMDLHWIGRHPCFESMYFEHGYPYLEDDIYIYIVWCLFVVFCDSPIPKPSHTYLCKVFQQSYFLLTSHFRGHLLHT
jgi:hypothetical protein